MQGSFREKDRVQLHITADKREIKDFPKLPSATSFICKTLYERLANKRRKGV